MDRSFNQLQQNWNQINKYSMRMENQLVLSDQMVKLLVLMENLSNLMINPLGQALKFMMLWASRLVWLIQMERLSIQMDRSFSLQQQNSNQINKYSTWMGNQLVLSEQKVKLLVLMGNLSYRMTNHLAQILKFMMNKDSLLVRLVLLDNLSIQMDRSFNREQQNWN